MEYSYMGIFSTIFNWILEKILSPVFQFISKLLSSALSWIFNTVLAPVLKEVFWPIVERTGQSDYGNFSGNHLWSLR